jgi:UDP-N-acetylmuramoyl-L-alanyl-D-glutamate--2,6-diaminopimelate ligase
MGRMSAQALKPLLQAAGIPVPSDFPDLFVTGLKTDSRAVGLGDAFLALQGAKLDGSAYVTEAIRRGAAAVLVETSETSESSASATSPSAPQTSAVPTLSVPGLRGFTGPLYDAWYGYPSQALQFYGITGTNGKSTTVLLMSAILRAVGRGVVSLGTIRYQIGDEILDSTLTTPSTESFYELLARGVSAGCDSVAMEVSSHALSQDRVRGVKFRRALFTNLTQDHLDFHADFEDYFAAKKKLFTEYLLPDGVGVVNLDSPYGVRLLTEWSGERFTFSRGETPEGAAADLVLRHAELALEGTKLTLAYRGVEFTLASKLVGNLNVENLLAAAAFGLSLGLRPEMIVRGIADVTVPGRNEVFRLASRGSHSAPATEVAGNGSDPQEGAFAVVDYAHTPDALERVLASLRPLTPGRLLVVFGCGGDRDRGKRPIMGEIAERLADQVILTSDNPRSEAPEAILAEIRSGMRNPAAARVLTDRREAIRNGLESLSAGDCLLVAGKGHEDYQILGTGKIHFRDQEEIAAWN